MTSNDDLITQMCELGIDPDAVIATERARQADLQRLMGSSVHRLWQCLEDCVPCWGIKFDGSGMGIFACPTAIEADEDEDVIEGAEGIVVLIKEIMPEFGVNTRERNKWETDKIGRIIVYPDEKTNEEDVVALFDDLVRLDQLLENTKQPEPNIYLSFEARKY